MAIALDHYTTQWDDACRLRIKLRPGTHVRINDACDAREYDAFCRRLSDAGLTIGGFIRWMPRLQANVYRIERA